MPEFVHMRHDAQVGLLSSALSHLGAEEAGTKHDFVVALARGVGANMTPEVRANFYADLGRWVCLS